MIKRIKNIKNKELVILFIIVILYSLLSFYNLGSTKAPKTYYEAKSAGEELIFDIGSDPINIGIIRTYTHHNEGLFEILISLDNETYNSLGYIELNKVFTWQDTALEENLRYVKLVSVTQNTTLGEISLYDLYGYPINLKAMNKQSEKVIDEIDVIPKEISFLNNPYFDELNYARSAYEHSNGIDAYDWVYPPLGKIIQMIPIKLLGMTPFNYRLMANISGILMIVVMYFLGLELFKNKKWALFGALLLTLDNFHFSQTRIGTIDSFLVLFIMSAFLFMFKYLNKKTEDSFFIKSWYLFLTGVSIGLAISIKWTALLAGFALFILYLIHFIKNTFLNNNKWTKQTTNILLITIFFLVIIPIYIYVSSFFFFPNLQPYHIDSFANFFRQQQSMFDYHFNLTDVASFASPWYSWPLMLKPVWFYMGEFEKGYRTINNVGNPLIWWSGLIALVHLVIKFIFKKEERVNLSYIMIPFILMWVPYLFLNRGLYIYYFFPAFIFLILAIVDLFKTYKLKKITYIYLGLILISFSLFYPVSSGLKTNNSYSNFLKLLPEWYF